MILANLFLSPVLNYLPEIFMGGVIIAASRVYSGNNDHRFLSRPVFFWLVILAAGFRLLYATFLTWGQYYLWKADSLTQTFLNSPLSPEVPPPGGLENLPILFQNPLGYFLFYSYGRFWLNVFLSLVAAAGFYLFLKFLKRYNGRFFLEGEVEIGFIAALSVGWPNFVLFVPAVLISVVLISIYRLVFLGEAYTTLGYPLLLGAILILIGELIAVSSSSHLVDFLKLGIIRV